MVGARFPHKNVDEVLAMADLWLPDFKLVVCSSSGAYKKRLLHQAKRLNALDKIEFKDYISREELVRLYQNCSALLYPSKWEGFGIPPLEALACGRPVIASDIPVHREILGDSAFFVKLGNKDSWAAAFDGIRCTDTVAHKLNLAKSVLDNFTWNNTVDTLMMNLIKSAPTLTLTTRK